MTNPLHRVLRVARSPLARNSALFALPMAVFAVSGLLSIPLLLSVVTPERWSAIVASQAIGGFAAIIIAFGWGATGPITAARATPDSRGELYVSSLMMRLAISAIVIPVATVGSCLIAGFDQTIALSAIGAAIPGLSATWYFIGLGQPLKQLWLDTVPRVLGVLLGLAMAVLFEDPMQYALATALGAAVAVIVSTRSILKGQRDVTSAMREHLRLRRIWQQILAQRSGAVTVISSSLYANLPIVMVQALNPSAAPTFNMAFKIMRYGAIALLPVMQSIQAWTPKVPVTRDRLRLALRLASGSSMLAAVVVGLTSSFLSNMLSHGQIVVDPLVAIAIALAVFSIGMSQHVGLTGLVLIDKQKTVAVSTVLGAVFGVPAIALATLIYAEAGAMIATALAELVVLVLQLAAYLPSIRKSTKG